MGAGAADWGRAGSAGRDDPQTRSSAAVAAESGGEWRHGQVQRGERHHCLLGAGSAESALCVHFFKK